MILYRIERMVLPIRILIDKTFSVEAGVLTRLPDVATGITRQTPDTRPVDFATAAT